MFVNRWVFRSQHCGPWLKNLATKHCTRHVTHPPPLLNLRNSQKFHQTLVAPNTQRGALATVFFTLRGAQKRFDRTMTASHFKWSYNSRYYHFRLETSFASTHARHTHTHQTAFNWPTCSTTTHTRSQVCLYHSRHNTILDLLEAKIRNVHAQQS